MDTLEDLPGLGPKSAEWLREAGVETAADLREVGAPVAFLRVERLGVRPSRNLLWALYGAIQGKPWTAISAAEKRTLVAGLAELRDE